MLIFCILIILIFFIYQSSGPVHSLPVIHGKAGVSHLCLHNNTMYSAGRDGVYRQLRIHNNTLEVIDTKKVLIIAVWHISTISYHIASLWTGSGWLQGLTANGRVEKEQAESKVDEGGNQLSSHFLFAPSSTSKPVHRLRHCCVYRR